MKLKKKKKKKYCGTRVPFKEHGTQVSSVELEFFENIQVELEFQFIYLFIF